MKISVESFIERYSFKRKRDGSFIEQYIQRDELRKNKDKYLDPRLYNFLKHTFTGDKNIIYIEDIKQIDFSHGRNIGSKSWEKFCRLRSEMINEHLKK